MEKVVNGERMIAESKEIFKYLDKSIYDKIPENIKEFVNGYDGDYVFTYDTSKKLDDQKICQETKDFVVAIYYMYVADEEGKKRVLENIEKYEAQLKKKEEELNDVFKNRKEEIKDNTIENNSSEQQALIAKEESFFKKIINKILNLFGKGK